LDHEHIAAIAKLFRRFRKADQDGVPVSRVLKNADFSYRTITIEHPLVDTERNHAIVR
jgi:hypothetical protein